jgi:thiol-disulfide isomerase/thioredoxin
MLSRAVPIGRMALTEYTGIPILTKRKRIEPPCLLQIPDMMKRKCTLLILASLALFVCTGTFAQTGKVPPFRMVQPDGKVFKAENLPFGKPILIVYFSPDCEDCHRFINDLLARIKEFRDVSIAMITYQPVENISEFVAKNKLKSYSNIYVGTEGSSLFVRDYFKITRFPFVALYNKDGDLIKKYTSGEITINDLSEHLKLAL